MGDITLHFPFKLQPYFPMLPYKNFPSIFDLGGPLDVFPCFLAREHFSYATLGGGPLFTITHGLLLGFGELLLGNEKKWDGFEAETMVGM